MQDQFWGDRTGTVTDPFGHVWTIATHKEDVDPKEMKRRFEAMMKGEGDVVTGLKNKLQVAAAAVTPAGVLAERHRKMAKPSGADTQR